MIMMMGPKLMGVALLPRIHGFYCYVPPIFTLTTLTGLVCSTRTCVYNMDLGHLQRADASRSRASERIRSDRRVISVLPAVRHNRTDASGAIHP
jgi:hypothetical protein